MASITDMIKSKAALLFHPSPSYSPLSHLNLSTWKSTNHTLSYCYLYFIHIPKRLNLSVLSILCWNVTSEKGLSWPPYLKLHSWAILLLPFWTTASENNNLTIHVSLFFTVSLNKLESKFHESMFGSLPYAQHWNNTWHTASTTSIWTENIPNFEWRPIIFSSIFPFQISPPSLCKVYYEKYFLKLFPIHNTFLFCFEKTITNRRSSLQVKYYQERQPVACP